MQLLKEGYDMQVTAAGCWPALKKVGVKGALWFHAPPRFIQGSLLGIWSHTETNNEKPNVTIQSLDHGTHVSPEPDDTTGHHPCQVVCIIL